MKRGIVVAALLAVAACGGGLGGGEPEGAAGSEDAPSAHDLAIEACHEAILDRSKSPSTVDFISTEADGDHYVSVEGEVDAQNPMGATMRSSYLCGIPMTPDGKLKGEDFLVNVTPRR